MACFLRRQNRREAEIIAPATEDCFAIVAAGHEVTKAAADFDSDRNSETSHRRFLASYPKLDFLGKAETRILGAQCTEQVADFLRSFF